MEKSLAPPQNPLGTEKIGKLILKFAIPSIIGMLVSALYNIVDQIFIGQGVGMLGNAATNVAFPITTICTAIALLLGIGSAANFNLCLGRGEKETASHVAGNGLFLLVVCGVAFCAIVLIFLNPLLHAFGATDKIFSLAQIYVGITGLGIPFLIFTTGASHLIRADGSPTYSMFCMLTGAILNTILDPIFIFVLHMGIAGAAWATLISQIVSCILMLLYMTRFKTMRLTKRYIQPKMEYVKMIVALGAAASLNQIAMTVFQIVMNNTLKIYGAHSQYGSEIPLACVGVITKVIIVLVAISVGIALGCQPIFGFNYGAKNYARVQKAFFMAATALLGISIIAELFFQLMPRQIISIFGNGSEEYFHFAERYFRIFMAMTFISGLQPLIGNFFSSIGKAKKGMLVTLTKQFLFLVPLVLIFPLFFGIDGVMYAGPIADTAAIALAIILVYQEFKHMSSLA
ncbi:MATE family efflux transporter [Lachnospiraceae bacterium ZAX-1]